jgi:hypothetical protein
MCFWYILYLSSYKLENSALKFVYVEYYIYIYCVWMRPLFRISHRAPKKLGTALLATPSHLRCSQLPGEQFAVVVDNGHRRRWGSSHRAAG